jgi:catechol 2,3-dioxygenase-like lactoylglutathione lyase family enzyme
MPSRFTEIVIDAHDPDRLARFWAEVLGYHVTAVEEYGVEIAAWEADPPDLRERLRREPGVPTLVFIRVPEGKTVKNRLHIDVSPTDRSTEEEVERLLALGATRADVGQQGDESWTVLADPEGNEFCVLRSLVA